GWRRLIGSSGLHDRRAMVLDQFRLDGKTALVTGASAGLGAAMAVALAEAGADLICHSNSRPADTTCNAVRRLGRRAFPIRANLGDENAAEKMFADAERLLPVDILVNNAGTIRRARALDYTYHDWMTVLQVNLNSVF